MDTTSPSKRGALKIFLGMAPGVGKTSSMLKAGYDQLQKGIGVAVGVVESGEDDSANDVLSALPCIPPLRFASADAPIEELDIDEIVRCAPRIVLVDRMEHINSPGARHGFRYQDIEEILRSGVSVYTTLNVHHIEGLIDVVRQVTGVSCSETVPDRLFDAADEIELIDMPTDELLAKFRDGRIRLPDYLRASAHEFYRKGNLIALREIALRRLARRVNVELTEYMQARSGTSRRVERILVAVGPDAHSEHLIRAADQLASGIDAPWFGAYIQTPRTVGQHTQEQIRRNLELVGELGGELVTAVDNDIVSAILRIAQEKGITQIVVGKPLPRSGISALRARSVAADIIDRSECITVHAVRQDGPGKEIAADAPERPHPGLAARTLRSVVTAVVGRDPIVKRQERRTAALFAFVKDVFSQQGADNIVRQIVRHIESTFQARVAFYAPSDEGEIDGIIHPASTLTQSGPQEVAAAQTALLTKKRSGTSTAAFRTSAPTYYPLVSGSTVEGVVGLGFDPSTRLSIDDEALLLMFTHQAAISLEKQRLRDKAQKAQVLTESDRLYKTLFNSLSHELRTPLATICGASSSLRDGSAAITDQARATLATDIYNAADRLNRLVANLLDMSRIESGTLRVKPEWCDIADILNAISDNLSHERHPVVTDIDDAFPLLKIDNGLITQAFLNIALNAIQHSPDGVPIAIRAWVEAGVPTVSVADNGPGFPGEAIPRLFTKFYRVPGSAHPGTGLGLSIARGFVEAHKGIIEAVNRSGGGALVTVRFPLTPQSQG